MSSVVSTVVSEIIRCFFKWTSDVRRATRIRGMNVARSHMWISWDPVEDVKGVVWMLVLNMERLTLWQSPLDHLHHEAHRLVFLFFSFPQANWPPQTSQYRSSCILGPAAPWGLAKQTNCWAGMGPPMVHHLLLGMVAALLIVFSSAEWDRAMKFCIPQNPYTPHQRWSS